MLNIYLSSLDIALIIIIPSVIVLGILIILLTGVYHVKKDRIYIIEKYNQFDRTLTSGWYYLLPLIYRRAAFYSLKNQYRVIKLENGKYIKVTYKIVDVKTYHYKAIQIDIYLKQITKDKDDITFDYLKDEFNKIGIELIKIEQFINNDI